MQAKFYSKCPACGQPIEKGAEIVKATGKSFYVHAACDGGQPGPDAPAAALAPANSTPETLVARFVSECNICRSTIEPGQSITRPRGRRGFVHVDCAPAPDTSKASVQWQVDEDGYRYVEHDDAGPDVDAKIEAEREREEDFEF